MKRIPALFLSVLILLGVLALPALADSAPPPEAPAAEPGETTDPAAEPGAATDPAAEPGAAADPAAEPGAAAEAPPDTVISAAAVRFEEPQNSAETIEFERLRAALHRYNPTVNSLEGQIADLNSNTTDSLWDSIIGLDRLSGQLDASVAIAEAGMGSENADLAQIYGVLLTSLKVQQSTFEMQKMSMKMQMDSLNDNVNSAQNTLNNAINQLVSGAETLYAAIVTMEDALPAVQRGLDALDRAVAITEKQQELGMASAYDAESIRHQRSQVESQLESLRFQIRSNKMTLENMCDMPMNGDVRLGALPLPTADELSAVSYDKNLSTATRRNVDVANAQIAYDGDRSGANRKALESAKSTFAAKFKVACITVPEKSRLVDAARETVDFQQRTFDIAAKKYELGMTSREEYLSAQNDLDSAGDDFSAAQVELFNAYHAYAQAIQYGLA